MITPQDSLAILSITLPVFLTSEQVRAQLGISRTTLWRYIVKGWLHPRPTFRDGRAHIFLASEVTALQNPRPAED